DLDLLLGRGDPDLGEPLGQVLHAALQLGVEVLEVGAASGGVDDQGVKAACVVGLRVGLAQSLRSLEVAVMREQRAAASLAGREPDLAARELQELDRGVVRLGVRSEE